jgi:hypothetical protein
MFKCERCGSRYSAMHAPTESCPRCRIRDRISAPLTMSQIEFSGHTETSVLPSEEPGLHAGESSAPSPHP